MSDPSGILVVSLDLDKPAGQQLAPQFVAELDEVAPSAVNDRDITEAKLADKAVSSRALGDGAVQTGNIGLKQVSTGTIADNAVTGTQLADGAVTAAKAGIGVLTMIDADGNPISIVVQAVSDATYAGLATPDPGTWYVTLG